MTVDFISLALITIAAALCPLLAQLIPRKIIPETVLLLAAGAVLGPHCLDWIRTSETISFLSDIGMAFLFLLAGYEIEVSRITGTQGKRGFLSWLISLGLGFIIIHFAPVGDEGHLNTAVIALACTTTAFGALVPILKERELEDTAVGKAVVSYGTWGELGPVIAMALLLSTRAEWLTVLILLGFAAISVLCAVIPKHMKHQGNRLFEFINASSDTTSQSMTRFTITLLVCLVTLSAVFQLDVVLGAFAAGFILRYIIPEGHAGLETKLQGIAYGFFIPLFFISSGLKIDVFGIADEPNIFFGFLLFLLLIRAVPVIIVQSTEDETTRLNLQNRITVALYCTTALPVIVALTNLAVSAQTLSQETASVLVAAGAASVFLMPFLASISYRVIEDNPPTHKRKFKLGSSSGTYTFKQRAGKVLSTTLLNESIWYDTDDDIDESMIDDGR